ncbi:MAG: hypothetical protein IJA55_01035 [Clostridia bacterium]|nr:hypothetical protein [Clostridia bacterium]
MEEIFVETAKDESADIQLQYAVLCTADPQVSDPVLSKVYSLLVIMTCGKCETETVFVYDISRTRDRALEITRVMCDNTVTPCTVKEILDDIL